MFKFIKPKGGQTSYERQKLQKELFSYSRTLQHGFPSKPTALAWDPELRLFAIGNASGAVKVFGRPGVEFYGQHQNSIGVTKLVFLPGEGRVVSLCEDNCLCLWEINKTALIEVKGQLLEGKLKKISTICVASNKLQLLLGTEGGNIYPLDLLTFTMTPDIIYQDVVIQNVSQEYKPIPGAVEVILEQPGQPNNFLIGYNRGLIVLWDRQAETVLKTFVSQQQLESLCWHDDGKRFTSSHNDGSYAVWDIEHPDKPETDPVSVYGPFPCRAIPKIISETQNGKPLIVFSGGLPRANYSDKCTVSVIHGDPPYDSNKSDLPHATFDFTSKVIDFVVIHHKTEKKEEVNGFDNKTEPEMLLVLCEEELVAIDLESKEWKMMNLPYLNSLHASSVTCSQYISGVPHELWQQLIDAGTAQTSHLFSDKPWPIDGGDLLCSKGLQPRHELLLTGHEDGTVKFWNAGGVTLTLLYKFSTAQFFAGTDMDDEVQHDPDDSEGEWPPLRKTGIFDPYSDDPRFAIKKVSLCSLSGNLVVAGTAGQIIIAKFDTETLTGTLNISTMNIVNDRDGFVWKGHSQLTPKTEELTQTRGFQARAVVQLYPPAAITCCALQADWGLVAAGTAHGLAVYDFVRNKPVTVQCTLNPNDLTGAGDAPISRRKSFKKSLRESFRRLRKGRSQRRTNTQTPATTTSPTPRKISAVAEDKQLGETKPVERQIEARPTDDSMSSYVRCLYFARTFLINVQSTIPTLWAGINSGSVYAYSISVPNTSKREDDDVECKLAKEIQLKHRAPVISIAVLDGANKPLPEPLEVEKGVAPLPDTTQPHRVVIASEEQFKIFTLPNLKPYGKFKLTAHDGARVRRMSFASFQCKHEDQTYNEIDLLCLTNLGDCLILSVPDLKRQLNAAPIKREDINGISSLVFTNKAEGLYLHSSSELQRFSLSSTYSTKPRCYLTIAPGARLDAPPEDREALNGSPLVNGVGSLDEKTDDICENGEESVHNTTVNSSVGDITLDSVREHLIGEESSDHITNTIVTKTVTTDENSVTSSSVVAVAATESSENHILDNVVDGLAPSLEVKKVSDILLVAPLALEEESDGDCAAVGLAS